MAMSLQDIQSCFAIAESTAVVIASFGTLALALYGLKSWLREYRGKRDSELCEEVLEKFYAAQEAVRWMRSPLVLTSEIKKFGTSEAKPSDIDRARANAQVLFDRYNAKQDLFSSIHSLRYRFMARFGKEEAAPFDQFHKTLHRLFRSARMLSHLWSRPTDHFRTDEQWQAHWDKIEKEEAIFWSSGSDDSDEVEKSIEATIRGLEEKCRRRIVS